MQISCYSAFVDDDGSIWIPSSDIDAIFVRKKYDGCQFIFSLNSESIEQFEIIKIVKFKDTVYIFERNRYRYWKYNTNTKELIKSVYYKINEDDKTRISSAIYEDGRIWLFPIEFNLPVFIIELQNEKVNRLVWNVRYRNIDKYIYPDELIGSSMVKPYFDGKRIYLSNRKRDSIFLLEIDYNKHTVTGKRIDGLIRINAIAVSDYSIFVLGLKDYKKTVLYKVDKESWKVLAEQDLSDFISIHDQNPLEYLRMICIDDTLLIFSVNRGKVLMIRDMQDVCYLQNSCSETAYLSCYDYQINDEGCYIFSIEEDGISLIRKENNSLIAMDVLDGMNAYIYAEALKQPGNRNRVINESANINLQSFIYSCNLE